MEKVVEKAYKAESKEEIGNKEKKYIRICGITLWRIFAYFIIYSIAGFIVETIFGIAKYGMLESRKSFLYGPFCAIYGVGAIIMILSLQYVKNNHSKLFIGGCIVGIITEYIVSWVGETFLNLKWWDYSNMPLNINGRVCLLYAVFWGILGLVLMISINPRVDRLIDYIKEKIPINVLQILVVIGLIIMLLDCISTAVALHYFSVRTIKEKGIVAKNQSVVDNEYNRIYGDETKTKIINRFFNNEKMLMTFPRLTIQNESGDTIYARDLYPEIKTYFIKISD